MLGAMALNVEIVELAIERARARASGGEIFLDSFDVARTGAPSELWDLMEPVQVEQDAAAAEQSIRQLTSEHPPPSDLSAVWFGLYEIGDYPNDVESVVELSGGPGFPDPDWLFQQTWHPPGYLATPGLTPIARLASPFGDALFSLVTYSLAFAYSLALTCELVNGPTGTLLTDDHDQLGVAVGFHDGDILRVGALTAEGLDTASMGWG